MKTKSCFITPSFFLFALTTFAQQDTGMITGQVLDATASAVPAATVFLVHTGTSVRTTVGTGPSRTNFDFSLFKDFAFDGEARRKLQFRAEFFNILNMPQFQIPNRTFNTPQFGTITETINDNRDVQLALRFVW
ncbi:MAG: carboxypeptidase-like regulatory domain-containing protein [Bryobacteraceae bacterium]